MRLVIHIGLNKAASTWLQHSLATNTSREVYYEELHPYFRNHVQLNSLIQGKYESDAVAWINNYARSACLAEAECAVISSEDIWQELPFNGSAASALEKARIYLQSSSDISVRYLIIKRNFHKWAFSYCNQLINNEGGLSHKNLEDFFQSSVNIAQFPVIATNQLPSALVDVVSCDEPGFEARIQSIISPSFQGLQDRINVSRPNEIALAVLSGALRSLYSSSKGLHTNCEEADSFVAKFQLAWEEMLSNRDSEQAREIFAQYDFDYKALLQEQASSAFASLSETEREFWTK